MDLITPMLATPSSSASSRRAIAIGDVEKVEGIRALRYPQDGEIRLISRTVSAWASPAVVDQVVGAQTDADLALAGHPLLGKGAPMTEVARIAACANACYRAR